MYEIRRTDIFLDWLKKLKDAKGQARILARLESLRLGNFGDVKSVGSGVRELRVHAGPGYRVYFVQTGKVVLVLLCGGSKSTQRKDIQRAIVLSQEQGME